MSKTWNDVIQDHVANQTYKYYFTFGSGSNYKNCFTVVEAKSEIEAREIILSKIGNVWAFCYREKEFEGQVDKFGLREIPFEQITKEDATVKRS